MAFPETKRTLLEKCLRGELGVAPAFSQVPRRNPRDLVPLSHSQEQVWMHAQLVPDVPLYNEPVTIHYSGKLDPVALEQSFNEVLRRHEAWRTCFTIVDGQPVQDVTPEPALPHAQPYHLRRSGDLSGVSTRTRRSIPSAARRRALTFARPLCAVSGLQLLAKKIGCPDRRTHCVLEEAAWTRIAGAGFADRPSPSCSTDVPREHVSVCVDSPPD